MASCIVMEKLTYITRGQAEEFEEISKPLVGFLMCQSEQGLPWTVMILLFLFVCLFVCCFYFSFKYFTSFYTFHTCVSVFLIIIGQKLMQILLEENKQTSLPPTPPS